MKSFLIFAVCCVHLFFVCCIVFKKPPIAEKKKLHPIAVRTVREEVRPPVIAEKKPVAAAPKPKPVSAPPPKPVAPKPVPKKEAPKKKSVQQRSTIPPSLLKELEESIAKIEDKGDKHKLSKRVPPSRVQPLHIDASNDASYIDILTQHLHTSLHLPDFGEVKIELTLQQDGTVATLKVLNAES